MDGQPSSEIYCQFASRQKSYRSQIEIQQLSEVW